MFPDDPRLDHHDDGIAYEPRKIAECVYCGRPIYEGDLFFDVVDDPMCNHCVQIRWGE